MQLVKSLTASFVAPHAPRSATHRVTGPITKAATAFALTAIAGTAHAPPRNIDLMCHYNAPTDSYIMLTYFDGPMASHAGAHASDFRFDEPVGVGVIEPVPVYAIYDAGGTLDHMYTTSAAERDAVLASGLWVDEGILGYAFDYDGLDFDAVYRMYNGIDHLYTTDAGEIAFFETQGYVNEGVVWYALPSGAAPLSEVYQLSLGTDHLMTMDPAERDAWIAAGATDEGVLANRFTAPYTCRR